MDLLSECLQDQFTEKLSALLTRQFLEKDARLKQVMLSSTSSRAFRRPRSSSSTSSRTNGP
jgi:hypothetical protein